MDRKIGEEVEADVMYRHRKAICRVADKRRFLSRAQRTRLMSRARVFVIMRLATLCLRKGKYEAQCLISKPNRVTRMGGAGS